MPLRPLTFDDFRRKIEGVGFEIVGQRGSHVKFAKTTEEGTRTAIVPRHREISVGTIRSALRQAGITVEDWERL